MKRLFLILFMAGNGLIVHAQNITGEWNGLLKVQGTELRLGLHITKTGTTYRSTMDSPDQGAVGIPVNSTSFENGKLRFEIANLKVEYNGLVNDTAITGILKQNGREMPLNFSRESVQKKLIEPYQEAAIKAPFPYYTEEVSFNNSKSNVTLAGTLTMPAKNGVYPVVILITGSGMQNRDEELFGRRPFLIIADYLTKQGIAVLRYDDRGVAESTGDFKSATSADFAADVKSAITYLKTRPEINPKKIGLIGHSEGGMIAPMVAAHSKDVSFIVMLAGLGMQGGKLLLLQKELIDRAAGTPETIIQHSKEINTKLVDMILRSEDSDTLQKNITEAAVAAYKADTTIEFLFDQKASSIARILTSPWVRFLIKYDPVHDLKKVKCPVLALNGEKDLQVPPAENLAAIANAFKAGKNMKAMTRQLQGMNHLFQECKDGSPQLYFSNPQTFSPLVLEEMAKWIKAQVK